MLGWVVWKPDWVGVGESGRGRGTEGEADWVKEHSRKSNFWMENLEEGEIWALVRQIFQWLNDRVFAFWAVVRRRQKVPLENLKFSKVMIELTLAMQGYKYLEMGLKFWIFELFKQRNRI